MSAIQISEQLASVVEQFSKSVVRVEGRRRRAGSAVVWSSDGIIVTTHHAVERDEGITVGLADGQTVGARVLGRDPSIDLAVLQAEVTDLIPAKVESAADLKVGNIVMALARPGKTTRATWGIVSALSEGTWRTPWGGEVERYLETDLGLAPGFSGGPLVDARGRFLGMTTSVFARPGSAVVPAATLAARVETIRADGGVKRGYLGVGAYPVRLSKAAQDLSGRATGLVLLSIEPGGPAETAGLLQGDTLLELDNQSLEDLDDLLALLASGRAGKQAAVKVLRAGAIQTVSVKVGER